MGLLDYRYLFEQMVSVYVDKEVSDEITSFRESEALLLLDEEKARPKWKPEMLPTIESGDADGWHRAVGRLINSLMDAYSDTGLPLPLVAAVTHLKETASGTIFSTSGVLYPKTLGRCPIQTGRDFCNGGGSSYQAVGGGWAYRAYRLSGDFKRLG